MKPNSKGLPGKQSINTKRLLPTRYTFFFFPVGSVKKYVREKVEFSSFNIVK